MIIDRALFVHLKELPLGMCESLLVILRGQDSALIIIVVLQLIQRLNRSYHIPWIETSENIFWGYSSFPKRIWISNTNIGFNFKFIVGLGLIQISDSTFLLSLTLLWSKVLYTAVIQIDSRDDAVIQGGNRSYAFPLALMIFYMWLKSLSRKLGIALRCELPELLMLLIHLVVWVATCCIRILVFSLNALVLLAVVHVATVTIHLH